MRRSVSSTKRQYLSTEGMKQRSLGVWGDSTYYMYDGGVIAADTKITLQDAELVTYEWVAPENLEGYVRPSMVERLHECYRALETGETLEMSNLDS